MTRVVSLILDIKNNFGSYSGFICREMDGEEGELGSSVLRSVSWKNDKEVIRNGSCKRKRRKCNKGFTRL